MRIKTAISVVLTLYIFESFLFCQVVDDPDVKIENINFYILNDQMNITYDLVNARPKDKFSVSAKIFTDSGAVLNSPSLIGHVGDNLSAGN